MAKNYLIVIDMQNDFVTGALGTPEAQAIVPDVARRARCAHPLSQPLPLSAVRLHRLHDGVHGVDGQREHDEATRHALTKDRENNQRPFMPSTSHLTPPSDWPDNLWYPRSGGYWR